MIMHRLIVHLKEPLNASFCEAVVKLFGQCELIPMTEDYCVIQGLKLDSESQYFERCLQFNETMAYKSFLGALDSDMDMQLDLLVKSPTKTLISDFKPPKVILFSRFEVSKNIWSTHPWSEPEF